MTLARAGLAYVSELASRYKVNFLDYSTCYSVISKMAWPFDDEWFKPSIDPVRQLTKAGALIAAEIDRLQEKNK